jgi:signal transduction histidine kinase
MLRAARRMQELINGMLILARVTTGAQPFASVDVAQIVRDVVSDLDVRLEQVAGRVELGDLPTIDADPTQMRQLIQNLIGNALKFSRSGEAPVVRISSQVVRAQEPAAAPGGPGNPWCEIVVEDNGIGFDEKYLDRIFIPFQRLHGQSTYEGTGIGLAVCQKIAQRHGGSITARSTPGQGTRFIVSLPVQQRDEYTRNG